MNQHFGFQFFNQNANPNTNYYYQQPMVRVVYQPIIIQAPPQTIIVHEPRLNGWGMNQVGGRNPFLKEKKYYEKKTKLEINLIKKFYNNCNNKTQTAKHFGIHHKTLDKILNGTYGIHKRKTTYEQDQYICE